MASTERRRVGIDREGGREREESRKSKAKRVKQGRIHAPFVGFHLCNICFIHFSFHGHAHHSFGRPLGPTPCRCSSRLGSYCLLLRPPRFVQRGDPRAAGPGGEAPAVVEVEPPLQQLLLPQELLEGHAHHLLFLFGGGWGDWVAGSACAKIRIPTNPPTPAHTQEVGKHKRTLRNSSLPSRSSTARQCGYLWWCVD